MKKNLISFFVVISMLLIPNIALAEETPIWEVVSCNSLSRWYDGTDKWSGNVLPEGCNFNGLVEGTDYVKKYAFTNDRNVNEEEITNWQDDTTGMKDAGFVWERIEGIGNYDNATLVRHNILTAIFIFPKEVTKLEGEEDPELTFTTSTHNNNPNNISDMFDITLTREEGETPGKYKINVSIAKKANIPDSELIMLNGTSVIGDKTNGFVYFYPQEGYLTIEKKATVKVKYVDTFGNILTEDSDEFIINGKVGDEYKTEVKEFEGYTLTETPKNSTGTFAEDDIEVTYVYKKASKVIVSYVDTDNKKLTDDVVIDGYVTDSYTTEEKDFNNYVLKEVKGDTKGTFKEEEIKVTYIYEEVGTGGDEEDSTEPSDGEITPPQTGVETNEYIIPMSLLSFSFVALVSKKRKGHN